MSTKPTILYVSFWPWEAMWSVPQHLAVQMADRYNIIYACPKQFHFSEKKMNHLKEVWHIKEIKDIENLSVLYFPFLPGWKSASISKLNHSKWAKELANFLDSQNTTTDILWLSSPDQLPFLQKFSSNLITYHCLDPYESFYPRLSLVEPDMFRKADVTFVTAPLLEEKAKKYSKEVHLVPNGVEVEHFEIALERSSPIPQDMSSIPSPRIGYIGTIAHWMDFNLVEKISNEVEGSLVFIGPVESEKAKALEEKGKIHLLNKKPYVDLPLYLSHFDVCIIPFKDNNLTKAVDPIKVYEYLAAGKDVVSTPLPALKHLSEFITLVPASEFSGAINRILQDPSSKEIKLKRSTEMFKHSWKSRAEKIMQVFEGHGIS